MDTKRFDKATNNLRESCEAIMKFNPNHEPAGSSEGGQFASGESGEQEMGTKTYAIINGIRYVTNDERAGAAIQALQDANNTNLANISTAIKAALVVASQTRDGLLFEIASRANEEFAQKMGASKEQARAATEVLRKKFQINPIQYAT